MKTSSKTWHRLQRKLVGESPGSLVKVSEKIIMKMH